MLHNGLHVTRDFDVSRCLPQYGQGKEFSCVFIVCEGFTEALTVVPFFCVGAALFQSLLYEACGRTVNPVFGAVGLLWSGNWGVCQTAVETVLKGGTLKAVACLPSTKPIQPLTLNKSQTNLSFVRPHSMIEASTDINAEAKRLRSSDQHEEHLELRTNPDVVQLDQSITVASKPVFMANSEVMRQDERPAPHGQLVAPVARRVNPQAGYGLAAMVTREHQQPSEEQERRSHESVELDLTLNSHAHTSRRATEPLFDRKMAASACHAFGSGINHVLASSVCNEEHGSFNEAARASSPCSFSMNSEGSVTSSDTAEFSVSCVRAFSPPTSRHEDCQLLHLL
eukprot:c10364_g1_i2 orf=294-1313(-)